MIDQGSPEWHRAHLGTITSSRVARVLNGTPKGWLSLMEKMRFEIESPDEALKSPTLWTKEIEHGLDTEDSAIANFELEYGVDVVRPGLMFHPELPWLGATSDFIYLDGANTINGEVKCPSKMENHSRVWINRQLPQEYLAQVQLQMLIHGAVKTMFVSFFSGMPDPATRMAVIPVKVDMDYQNMMMSKLRKFWSDFQEFRSNGGVLPLHHNVPQVF